MSHLHQHLPAAPACHQSLERRAMSVLLVHPFHRAIAGRLLLDVAVDVGVPLCKPDEQRHIWRGRVRRAERLEYDRPFRHLCERLPRRLDVFLAAHVVGRARHHRDPRPGMPRGDALYLRRHQKHLHGVAAVGAERKRDVQPIHRRRALLEALELLLCRKEVDGVVGLPPDATGAAGFMDEPRLPLQAVVVDGTILEIRGRHDRERPLHLMDGGNDRNQPYNRSHYHKQTSTQASSKGDRSLRHGSSRLSTCRSRSQGRG